MIKRVTSITSAYTALVRDDVIECAHTAAVAVTLPTVGLAKKKSFQVKDISASGAGTYNITVAGQGSETLDGSSSYVLSVDKGAVTFTANALRTAWLVS